MTNARPWRPTGRHAEHSTSLLTVFLPLPALKGWLRWPCWVSPPSSIPGPPSLAANLLEISKGELTDGSSEMALATSNRLARCARPPGRWSVSSLMTMMFSMPARRLESRSPRWFLAGSPRSQGESYGPHSKPWITDVFPWSMSATAGWSLRGACWRSRRTSRHPDPATPTCGLASPITSTITAQGCS